MSICLEKRVIKTILGWINYVVAASGLILISISAYGLYVVDKIDDGRIPKLTMIVALSFGLVIIFLAICEHFGRDADSFYMTTVYSHFMMTVMAIEMGVGAILMASRSHWFEKFREWIKDSDCELLATYGHCCATTDNIKTCVTCASEISCLDVFRITLSGWYILLLVNASVHLMATAYAYLFAIKLRYIVVPIQESSEEAIVDVVALPNDESTV